MQEGETNQTVGPCPGETWLQYVSPEDAGYSSRRLKEVQDRFRQMGPSTLLVIHDGVVLLAEGQVNRRFECRSIRKSFLSALYGVHVGKGVLDLNKTLADLDIDDEPPLTEGEKEARDSSRPGARWYYNNWDFNTLLTIFEQETGRRFFEEFKRQIADPLQMEEFRLSDTRSHELR